jgi:Holliday junction resolvase RusA-like endonuclease
MIDFFVPGRPYPQGSMRAISIGGRARVFHSSSKRLLSWRDAVADYARLELGKRVTLDEPVTVVVEFFLPKPSSVSRLLPSVKPDLDKLLRAILDALEQSGVIVNDSRVTTLSGKKRYAKPDQETGAHIIVQTEKEVVE